MELQPYRGSERHLAPIALFVAQLSLGCQGSNPREYQRKNTENTEIVAGSATRCASSKPFLRIIKPLCLILNHIA
jgi:hypothetical protein